MYHEKVPSHLAHAHRAQTLACFQRARTRLLESGYKDPDASRTIPLRMAQLEMELTHQKIKQEQKEQYMDNAEMHIEEAMLAAEMTGMSRHIVQTKFERAFMKGRRLELKNKRGLDGEHRAIEARVICQEIKSEGQKLQELDNDIWNENSGYASCWLERLEKLI